MEMLYNGMLLLISSQFLIQWHQIGGLKIDYDGKIYTKEIGICYKSGLSPGVIKNLICSS